jgi:hypothetical protein
MMFNSNKELSEAIISRVYANDGFVYGGYVRDLIAGIDPTDIDVQVRDPFQFVVRLTEISNNICVFGKEAGTDHYKADRPIIKLIVRSDDDDIEVPVDVSQTRTTHEPDIDVNQLQMRYGGITVHGSLNLAKVIEHIHSRSFVCFSRCEAHRRDKMLAKGWKNITGIPGASARERYIVLSGGGSVIVPAYVFDVVADVYKECGNIQAIKLLRSCTGCGLKESKDAIDDWAKGESWEPGIGNTSYGQYFERNSLARENLIRAGVDPVYLR